MLQKATKKRKEPCYKTIYRRQKRNRLVSKQKRKPKKKRKEVV